MTQSSTSGDIAIIGLGCRYPGDAKSPQDFFDMLLKGRSGRCEVPADRFNIDSWWHPSYDRHGTMVSRGGHFLREDIALFDAPFFSMTQAEANAMDPQHRMLLEITYESLENAGIPLESIVGSDTACFVGGFGTDYERISTMDLDQSLLYNSTGNGLTMMSNRLSWFYDLRGPSLTLSTACSSSLVALHLACQTIRSSSSQNRQALVGASSLILSPDLMTTLNPLHFLSPDSECFSFDARANGYSRGEGFGMLVLKHIDDAIRDNDCIRAVIRGTGVNQDGKTPGITLPSSEAQKALIQSTYKSAGLDPADTTYFEAHGTGTAAGDPLEMGAISAVFDRSAKRSSPPLYVGSVKPNIGHQEAGAGLAGLIKTILSLETGVIPPNINFETANSRLRLDESHFVVPTRPISWPTIGLRRASINSFGYGGTNGHCILDDAFHYLSIHGIQGRTRTVDLPAPLSPDSQSTDSGFGSANQDTVGERNYFSGSESSSHLKLYVLSAPDQNALLKIAKGLATFVKELELSKPLEMDKTLYDLAFTLAKRRSIFPWRTTATARSPDDLVEQLGTPATPVRAGKTANILFCFTGQGAQWSAMGRELLQYSIYQQSILAADTFLTSLGATWSVMSILASPKETTDINKPEFSQPLCTIVQIGLVDLLRQWKVYPTAVMGHSSGEIAAAYALGAVSAEDCWKIAYHRGRLAGELRVIAPQLNGAMMAVGLGESELQTYIDSLSLPQSEILSIACVNSPSSVTVSGDLKALERLESLLLKDQVFCRKLAVENAYHSRHMDCIAQDYLESLKDIQTAEPIVGVSMVSSVTGNIVGAQSLGAQYWVDNMTSPVQFLRALDSVFRLSGGERRKRGKTAIDTIIELGPHSALQGPIKQTLMKLQRIEETTYLSVLRRGESAVTTALSLAGKLWCKGTNVDLERVNHGESEEQHCLLTDLPKYPWNHTNSYWHETAMSKSRRLRRAPRTDLLGASVLDFSMLEPTWKNVIRKSELPWIVDHIVRGQVVFPAAGMVCAAVEGMRHIADTQRTLQSFELRDITIGRALIIPETDPGVEVFTRLRPRPSGLEKSMSPWYEFSFSSTDFSNGIAVKYREHASGLVCARYKTEQVELGERLEDDFEIQKAKERFYTIQKDTNKEVTNIDHYAKLSLDGYDYGPCFQGVIHGRSGADQAVFDLAIMDTKATMPAQFEYNHVIHPTILDAAMQSTSLAVGRRSEVGATVPTGMERIFISADIPKGASTKFVGFATGGWTGFRSLKSSMTVSTSSWEKILLEIHDLSLTGLGDNMEQLIDDDQAVAVRKVCSEARWKADIDLLNPLKFQSQILCNKENEDANEISKWSTACDKSAWIFIDRSLKSLTAETEERLPPHLKGYVKWLRERHMSLADPMFESAKVFDGRSTGTTSDDEEIFLEGYLKEYPFDGRLVNAIGRSLPAILDGTSLPFSIMLEDNMLMDTYTRSIAFKEGGRMFRDWFDLKGHKQPDMQILEIGAGSGTITAFILETLGGTGGRTPRFGSYCFTDAIPGRLEMGNEIFKDWKGRIDFKRLDIEKDPVDQGFKPESFDVIVTSHVFNNTNSLKVALSHCHQLLKVGGQIVIGELTNDMDHVGLIFKTLPEWRSFEHGREEETPITTEELYERLQLAGFACPHISVASKKNGQGAKSSMTVATKPHSANLSQRLASILIIEPSCSANAHALIVAIKKLASNNNIHVDLMDLAGASLLAAQGKLAKENLAVISLVDWMEPSLASCNKEAFEGLQKVLLRSSKIIWVGCGTMENGIRDPDTCAISGLLRCVRSENVNLRLHEIHLQKRPVEQSTDAASIILRVAQESYNTVDEFRFEEEIVEIGGTLSIPRLVDDEHFNRMLQTQGKTPKPELQPLLQHKRQLELTIDKPGLLDSLYFVDDKTWISDLPDDNVEVDVRANGVNTSDILTALGQVAGVNFGVDTAGEVVRLGSKVKNLRLGDRVAFAIQGAMRTRIRIHESVPQLLPDNMSFEDGTSVPLVFMAAYHSLIEMARVSRGERVLIHSAAGGLGQAMIQIGKYLGAELFVSVGSDEKRALMAQLGIPEDHILSSRSLSFSKVIKRITSGYGVDVIVNTLTGEAMRETWSCISPFGRFIELGRKNALTNNELDMKHFMSNVSFTSVNITQMCGDAPAKAASLLRKVFDLFRSGEIDIVQPVTIYDYSDIEHAFRTIQNGLHMGKVVLKMTEQSMVPTLPYDPHPLILIPNATYILVGGLGGLGRGLATFLADHGARHLAIFSRRNQLKPEEQDLISGLAARGVNAIVYTCDITVLDVVKTTFAKIASELPPIKGVIQAAMVLRDGLYESMTYDSWTAATAPKIQGTWNIHSNLPTSLDFFIMLSSISGVIGNRGQANYAAGNTYQDALAHYRHNLGLPAVTVDLGATTGLGWFEENIQDLAFAKQMENLLISKDEFFAILKAAMTGFSTGEHRVPTQLTTGAGSGGLNKAARAAGSGLEYWWLNDSPRMSYLRQLDLSSTLLGEGGDNVGELKGSLTAVTTLQQATEIISGAVAEKLAKAMMVAVEEIDVQGKPLSNYGVDSLVAAEIRNWCFRELKAEVGVLELLGGWTIATLSEAVAKRSKLVPEGVE